MTKQTKLAEAFGYMDQGLTAHAAAVKAKLPPSHLYVAIKKRKDAEMKSQGICPCCGQKLPEKK